MSKPAVVPVTRHKISGLAAVILMAMLVFTSAPAPATAADDILEPAQLNVGFIESSFFGIHRLDAEAAYKAFVRTVGRNKGYDISVTVRTFQSIRELAAIPTENQLDIVLLESWDYLEMGDIEWFEPLFATSERGRVAHPYLLVTRHDGDDTALKDLRDASLNLFFGANAQPGRFWLEHLLRNAGLGTPEDFFNQVELHTDPMLTVLPVFFGKRDAAVIDATKFELLAEMNPQLNRLNILATSEPLVSGILCLKLTGWASERFRQDLVQAITELHLQPAGQQILNLFKTEQLVPFVPEYLDSMRRLHAQSRSSDNPK